MENSNKTNGNSKGLESRIALPPLEIVSETSAGYNVVYDGRKIYVEKSDETSFNLQRPSCGDNSGLVMQLSMRPEATINQDVSAPKEFIPIMIFHELREKEYAEAGLDEPHQRAVNDEILFVLKHLSPSQAEAYFKFADNYRANEIEKQRKIEEAKKQEKFLSELKKRCEDKTPWDFFHVYTGFRMVPADNIIGKDRRDFLCTNQETANRINSITEAPIGLGNRGIIRPVNVVPIKKIVEYLNYDFENRNPTITITGDAELRGLLVEKGHNPILYNPLEDSETYDKLREEIGRR